MNLNEFIKAFLDHVRHIKEDESFIIAGLTDIYNDILQANDVDKLQWKHFTSFIIENVVESDMEDFTIPSKYISKIISKKFDNIYSSIELTKHIPTVMGGSQSCLRRFSPSTKIMDSIHHNQGIKKIITIPVNKTVACLDNLTEYIKIYDEECNLQRNLGPKKKDPKIDNAVLHFAYSNYEKRIGACLFDHRLSFWDVRDNFNYEMTFHTRLEYRQNFILYAEFCTTWVTVDTESNIYTWNIENETCKKLPKQHTKPIIDMKEIPQYKVIAACSLDKLIILWDIVKRHAVQEIKLDTVSVHSLAYSVDFRVMFSAGYENHINIWSFERSDCYHMDQLGGHNAQVTAIEVIKDTPLLISADEIGFIKTWDIRNLSCFQTIHFESKGSIRSFLYVNSQKLIGADIRLHWFEFEDPLSVNANGLDLYGITPIDAKYSYANDEILILTRSDVRIIDIFTGKIKKILANVKTDDADISHLELYLNHKKFILGDTKGNINTFDKFNGTVYSRNVCHNTEISGVVVDFHNKMVISTCLDSSIMVQKETCKKCERVKYVKNAHYGEFINAMCFSVHLNLIATSGGGVIFTWQYEYMKLMGACSNNFHEVVSMSFIDPYPFLVSLDKSNSICFWKLSEANVLEFYIPLHIIHLDGIDEPLHMKSFTLIPGDLEDISSPQQALPYVRCLDRRFKGGYIDKEEILDPTTFKILGEEEIKEIEEGYEKIYLTSLKENPTNQESPSRKKKKAKKKRNLEKVDKIEEAHTLCLNDDEGNVHMVDVQRLITKYNIIPATDQTKRSNYFPARPVRSEKNNLFSNKEELRKEIIQNTEECKNIEKLSEISPLYHHSWNMSSEIITMMSIIEVPTQRVLFDPSISMKDASKTTHKYVDPLVKSSNKLIITSSGTNLVKISSVFGEPMCKLNLDQPLPYSWRLVVDKGSQAITEFPKEPSEMNEESNTKSLISNTLFPKSESSISEKFNSASLIKSPSFDNTSTQSEVGTFHELYQKVNNQDKSFKNNHMKMTLKQLGIKKKEYIGKDEDEPAKKTSQRKNLKNTHLFDRVMGEKGASKTINHEESLFDMFRNVGYDSHNLESNQTISAKEWETEFDTEFQTIKEKRKLEASAKQKRYFKNKLKTSEPNITLNKNFSTKSFNSHIDLMRMPTKATSGFQNPKGSVCAPSMMSKIEPKNLKNIIKESGYKPSGKKLFASSEIPENPEPVNPKKKKKMRQSASMGDISRSKLPNESSPNMNNTSRYSNLNWISYSKMKGEQMPEFKRTLPNLDESWNQKNSYNNPKRERMNFLKQLEAKRKQFKKGVKSDFRQLQTDPNADLDMRIKNLMMVSQNPMKTKAFKGKEQKKLSFPQIRRDKYTYPDVGS
ncbi:unnamed protein product [Moneuplotes crassus]|uniref:Uncharacterized protein n=1 Tax=Euplotes crassus TaxID=5936 RepID=A0AAD1X1M5_EUPCR|nr:unnamed protein product [Moneuplotes crassus]